MEREVQHLKRRYREEPSAEKKVKFSDVEDDLVQHFPSTSYSAQKVSQAISTAFPNAVSKRYGKKRHKYLDGIVTCTLDQPTITPPLLECNPEDENRQLKMKVRQLEDRIAELEKHVADVEKKQSQRDKLDTQMQALLHPDNAVFHGIDRFNSFSLDDVVRELHTHAPDVIALLGTLGRSARHDDRDTELLTQLRVMSSLCTLLKGRSTKVLGVQLLITFMLLGRATNKQAISVLNHAGICVSYTVAWKYLKQLTVECRYLDIVREGHWLWIYDNLNYHLHIRHERQDHHSSMMNVTTRLAVRIHNLPDFPFSWSDATPQRSRQSLTIEDYLPNERESSELEERATVYVMGFIVEAFPCLNDLEPFVPTLKPLHPPNKSEVVPMKLLFRDEKYKSETIEILSQLIRDADLRGEPQVVVGDQLSCKCVRGCKLWREPEVDPKERLTWANEIPGDFHFLWECLRVLFTIFWGNPTQTGSLCQMRDLIRRNQVDKKVKVFNVGDEFLIHAFKAHLMARICTLLDIRSTTDEISHTCSEQWLRSKAQWLVSETIKPAKSSDPVYSLHRSFLHMAYLYVDLRTAIRWGNGPNIITQWKLWLPRFIATGCRNYSVECVHLIANLQATLPKHLSYISIHNRTVNVEGKPGRGKPLDQMMEHYNLVLKQAMKSGGNLTETHAQDLSLCALFLLEAAKKVDKEFNVHHTSAHTARESLKDIQRISSNLQENSVTSAVEDRTTPTFKDPTEDGLAKICNTSWVQDTLSKISSPQSEEDEQGLGGEQFVALDYEIADVV